jgi:hypothetical protein
MKGGEVFFGKGRETDVDWRDEGKGEGGGGEEREKQPLFSLFLIPNRLSILSSTVVAAAFIVTFGIVVPRISQKQGEEK